jgi:phenylalanyl-tRNA synthetase beta chain
MTISYNWLSEYLPTSIEPEKLSRILTSVGLEVESLEKFEAIKGGLAGLVIGEVMECHPHPNADKLSLTRVRIEGGKADSSLPEKILQIVCGAPNIAAGQKVVVAPPGTTIYPLKGEPFTIKLARIRGVESHGMICAEDEIGLGESHDGIIVLPEKARIGETAASWFKPYTDYRIEIGLTPNHMDAMSHQGVARDVCAWLSLHENKDYRPKLPSLGSFKVENTSLPVNVTITNTKACQRFSGVTIKGIAIKPSPQWMVDRLNAIGIRAINNIVDITNYVLHEMGQPLHAYDLADIKAHQIVVKNMPPGTSFITLDGKERRLSGDDLVIANGEAPMGMAGVFGGLHSGIKEETRDIFLESAWFEPTTIRRTSMLHGLRTDAAAHFEKGMDISGTVSALKRAAILVKELAGGQVASEIIDVYPEPANRTQVILKYHYLKKLSGKSYHPDTIKGILLSLGFEVLKENIDAIHVAIPWHKPDISLPADIVEEIMRIDGLDNIAIPAAITISPSVEVGRDGSAWRSSVAQWLVGQGFHEILTNSITNSAYYTEQEMETAVKMINSLSAELDILRPSMLETGLESVSYNLNRKNTNLQFFEFGKTYSTTGTGHYADSNHLCLYVTGQTREDSWKGPGPKADFYYLKSLCERIFSLVGLPRPAWEAVHSSHIEGQHSKLVNAAAIRKDKETIMEAGAVSPNILRRFDCKQELFYADIRWDKLLDLAGKLAIEFRELPRQLPVQRDLAMVVDKSLAYEKVERAIHGIHLDKLQEVKLFDIFESEKLGHNKKSLALSFTFLDEEKTLTDKEIDGMIGRIMGTLEREVQAEIRK